MFFLLKKDKINYLYGYIDGLTIEGPNKMKEFYPDFKLKYNIQDELLYKAVKEILMVLVSDTYSKTSIMKTKYYRQGILDGIYDFSSKAFFNEAKPILRLLK